MPGRQSHGRPLLAAPKAKQQKRSKAKIQKSALNAYGIAEEQYPTKIRKTPRARELDAEIDRKHSRDDDEDDEEEDEDEEGPSRKKVKRPSRPADGDADDGSDSEGNEWRLGGLREDDEDSEIESDDAFGDSDNERFEEYSFRGSKSKTTKPQDSEDEEDDSNDEEGETLGAEAIDLATALDQFEEESDEEPEGSDGSESEGSEEEDDEDQDEDSEESEDDESDDDAQPEKLEALEGIISNYSGADSKKDDKPSKQKINLGDLGLSGLDDPFMKKSVKLMNKESKEKRPGATKKLDVPLSRREQGRLDRSAAYEKTNETLDRWTDTVKHNRRAEHLVFPLPENSASAGLDRIEIQPLSTSKPANELESAIMSIMEQSGLSMDKPKKEKTIEYDEEGNELTLKEIQNRKRMQRELNSREAKRAKRIKKIKSKAYHRVHRKQQERDDAATREAMEEAGEIDSEQEREDQDRRRALERVGQRHRDSKWAKLGNKAKRAVWDDDYRAGLVEMARKDEELRRRKEGRVSKADDDDSDATSSSGSDDDDDLRRQLDELEQDDGEPQSKLMGMKFMQKAEAARKQANDQLIKDIRRELDGDGAVSDDEEVGEVGRRQYGSSENKMKPTALDISSRAPKRQSEFTNLQPNGDEEDDDEDVAINTSSKASKSNDIDDPTAGAWSRGQPRRKNRSTRTAAVDLDANILLDEAPPAAKPKSKPSKTTTATSANDADSGSDSDEPERHLPFAIRDQQLIARAFAGDDVVAEFEQEKEELVKDQDDKIIDNTLPGWGSWVGEGVSNREKKRHQGRFLTKVEGVKRNDRKDAKLQKVIINEKRIKKVRIISYTFDPGNLFTNLCLQNDQYLASALPHPFESRQQYERSLRLPVGPEWMTKETFQESTKPRVLIKQGVITAMSKPSK